MTYLFMLGIVLIFLIFQQFNYTCAIKSGSFESKHNYLMLLSLFKLTFGKDNNIR